MNKKMVIVLIALLLTTLVVLTSCAKPEPEVVEVEKIVEKIVYQEPPAAVSDGSEDLTVSMRLNVAEDDEANSFTFAGNIRYMAADADHYDAIAGASALGSTHLFNAYRYDIEGKATFPGSLRGVFLFGVTPYAQQVDDAFGVTKAADGTITIQYVHRGTAYKIVTDKSGKLVFPLDIDKRKLGTTANVLSAEFAADTTVASLDWAKVWDAGVAGDPIGKDSVSADASYHWDGTLQVAFDNDILTIDGFLTAVPN